jgi:hypothetical protein
MKPWELWVVEGRKKNGSAKVFDVAGDRHEAERKAARLKEEGFAVSWWEMT